MRDATESPGSAEERSRSANETRSETGVEKGVEIDPDQLSPGALRGLIEEFVTREGTEYGAGHELARSGEPRRHHHDPEWSLEDKVTQVYRQLATGEARIVFDLERESASILCTRILGGGGGDGDGGGGSSAA